MSLQTIEQALTELSRQEKLQLIEQLARSLRQPAESTAQRPPVDTSRAESACADRRIAFESLRRELATLPVANPDDGISNRDHDRVLYGASE